MKNPFLLLDCNYLCYRSRFAMGEELSYGGKPTTVIYTFLKELIALQEQFRTGNLLFCFDSRSSLRKRIYPEYKHKRHSKEWSEEEIAFEKAFRYQIKKLRKEYLPRIGYRNIYRETGYESDDLIAVLSEKLERQGERGIIISADHDLFQCISPFISFYNPASRKEMTFQGFKQTYGITPKQWAFVKAIAGCSTDGVEGIRGVGEKTAIKYIRKELGKKTKVYAAIISENGQRIIDRNKKLVALPFIGAPSLKIEKNELSKKEWMAVCKKLGFKSIRDTDPFPWSKTE